MKLELPGRSSIFLRTLLTVVVPLLAVILALGYYFTHAIMEDTRNTLNARGISMAEHLAARSEFGIYTRDIDELYKDVNPLLQEPDVSLVTITDISGNVLINASRDDRLDKEMNLIVFDAPVRRTGVNVYDYADEADITGDDTAGAIIGYVSVSVSNAGVIKKQKEILLTGTMITALGLLLSFLLALFVARSISDPITRLTHTVNKLTGGDLAVRTPEASRGELGTLEQGINQMAGALQGAQEELISRINEATFELQHTVTELEQRNTQLDIARSAALRAGAAKAEFLANMSHEIRTPLSAVIGFARLLEKTPQSDNQVEYTRTITQAASQLLLVIDDILKFSRLGSSSFTLEQVRFDLHPCLENVVSILSAAAHEKHLELVLYIHSDVPKYINSDANRISQILTNLVSNAIKFTRTGHVVVDVSLLHTDGNPTTLEIAVTDTGIGIDDHQLEHIFDPFTQADASTSRQYGGTGLGLPISKMLAELLGGEIRVSSTPGKGTTFGFTLPIAPDDNIEPETATPLSGFSVLVYDCNPFALRSLRNRFLSWGASIYNTSDWHELMNMLDNMDSPSRTLLVLGLSGKEYANRLISEILDEVRQKTDSPVLLLVGTEIHGMQTDMAGIINVRILSKPARSERLLHAARQLLVIPDEPSPVVRTHPVETGTQEVLAGLRVLVVEDNTYNQTLYTHMLGGLDLEVTMAANGEEACRFAAEKRYDIIIMDIHMPVMGGIEATRIIRKGINRLTPVIALTADVFAESENDPGIRGLDDVLLKPLDGNGLIDMLHKWGGRPATQQHDKEDTTDPLDRHELQSTTDSLPPEFRDKLRRELATRLTSVRACVESGEADELHEHLHQLKGVTDYFRMTPFAAGCRTLHQAAAAGDQASMLASLDKLDAILASGAE